MQIKCKAIANIFIKNVLHKYSLFIEHDVASGSYYYPYVATHIRFQKNLCDKQQTQ